MGKAFCFNPFNPAPGTAWNCGHASKVPFCEHIREHCTCPGKQGISYILFDQNVICRGKNTDKSTWFRFMVYFENLVSFK